MRLIVVRPEKSFPRVRQQERAAVSLLVRSIFLIFTNENVRNWMFVSTKKYEYDYDNIQMSLIESVPKPSIFRRQNICQKDLNCIE